MSVPTSEVGYTSAMPRREDHEVHKRTCGGIGRKIFGFERQRERESNSTMEKMWNEEHHQTSLRRTNHGG